MLYITFMIWWSIKFIDFKINNKSSAEKLPQILNFYFFETWCQRPLIFPNVSSVWSNNLSLKFKIFSPSSIKDTKILKLEFVASVQFLKKQLIHLEHYFCIFQYFQRNL